MGFVYYFIHLYVSKQIEKVRILSHKDRIKLFQRYFPLGVLELCDKNTSIKRLFVENTSLVVLRDIKGFCWVDCEQVFLMMS